MSLAVRHLWLVLRALPRQPTRQRLWVAALSMHLNRRSASAAQAATAAHLQIHILIHILSGNAWQKVNPDRGKFL